MASCTWSMAAIRWPLTVATSPGDEVALVPAQRMIGRHLDQMDS